jgi:iron complex outermembrane recepter protein
MSHDPSAIASVLRPPRSGKSEMRALLLVLACALSSLLDALPSYAQEPAPVSSDAGAPGAAAPSQPGPPQEPAPASSDAGAPDAPAGSAPAAAPSQPGATAARVVGPAPGSEPAASAAPGESGEIEVTTSRKRVEAVQETPVTVSVVGPRQLNGAEGSKIHNLDDLSGTVPNFTIENQPTSAGLVALSIRGISFTDVEKSFDMPIGIVIDGVYVGSNSGVNLQNFDLQSIEVLRGPQGTLFGRNTTGGLVNIRTMLPKTDEWGAKILARAGSFGQYDLMGSVNAPIVRDYVALKLTGSSTNLDGWYTNRSQEFNAASTRSGPEPATHNLDGIADLLVTPTKALSARLKYEHLRMRGTYGGRSLYPDPTTAECNAPQTVMSKVPGGGQVPALPFPDRYCSTTLKATNGPSKGENVTLGPYDSIQAWGQNANDADFNMVTGEVGYDLNKDYKLVSVTGWRHSHEYLELEDDSIPQIFLDSIREYNTDQVSEEVRLHGSPLPTLNFVVGGLLWHSWFDYRSPTENLLQTNLYGPLPPGFSLLTTSNQDTLSAAGFGQADWEFVKNTRLTAGLRYTWEQKQIHWQYGIAETPDTSTFIMAGGAGASYLNENPSAKSWANLSPRAGLDYQVDRSVIGAANGAMLYATYARGFHSGGYNTRANSLVELGPYGPESVDSFELGAKTSWARNRLVVNVAGFYTLFHDKQEFITQIAPKGSLNPVYTVPENAAQASIKGFEYEIQGLPLRGLDVALISNLRLWTTGGVIDARYDDFKASFGVVPGTPNTPNPVGNFSGTPLLLVPDFQAAVGATIPFDLNPTSRIIVDGQLRYRTEMAMCFLADPTGQFRNPLCNSPAAHRLDASVSYEMDQIATSSLSGRITVFSRNLTDQVTLGALGPVAGITWIASNQPPRSYGVEVALNF